MVVNNKMRADLGNELSDQVRIHTLQWWQMSENESVQVPQQSVALS
jgi:hypothetical protein